MDLTLKQIETALEVASQYDLSVAETGKVLTAIDGHAYYPRYVYHVAHHFCAITKALRT